MKILASLLLIISFVFSGVSNAGDIKKKGHVLSKDSYVFTIEEANNAFRLNMDIFNELEGSATRSLLKLFWNWISQYINNWRS